MTTQEANLKLVGAEQNDALAFERRTSSRHVLTGRVTAVRTKPDAEDHHKCISSLELLNISTEGLGVLSQEPVSLDSSITIFFPPHGPERGMDMYGRVVRCIPRSHGHELGIQLYQRMAA